MRTLTTLAALLVLATTAFAHTLYVSPAGDNAGSGSASAPFRTIQFGLDHLSVGDTLLLLPGLYNEEAHITVENVTVASATAEIATIDGSGSEDVIGGNGFNVEAPHVRLERLRFDNWRSTAMWVHPNSSFFTIDRVECLRSPTGIGVDEGCSFWTISNCYLHDLGGEGTQGIGLETHGVSAITSGLILNCKVRGTGVEGNGDGIALGHELIRNIDIVNCDVANVGDGYDISGFNIRLIGCYSGDCIYGGNYKIWHDSVTMINCVSYHGNSNVELDAQRPDTRPPHLVMLNCTLYDPRGSNVVYDMDSIWDPVRPMLQMYNCVLVDLHTESSYNLAITNAGGPMTGSYRGDHNLLVQPADAIVIDAGFDSTYTFERLTNGDWTAVTGQDGSSIFRTSVEGIFVDTFAVDLHPAASSPLIGAGMNVKVYIDRDSVLRHTPPDIGAYEHTEEAVLENGPVTLLAAYPNPYDGELRVEAAAEHESTMSLELWSATGELLYASGPSHVASDVPQQFRLNDKNAAGLRLLRLIVDGNVVTRLVLKR